MFKKKTLCLWTDWRETMEKIKYFWKHLGKPAKIFMVAVTILAVYLIIRQIF